MIPITLGLDRETSEKVCIHPDLFRTHIHMIGATGSGKTTAIQTLLRPLLMTNRPKCALFLVDPMGNLSRELLAWIAHGRGCPRHVRERLVYIEPAREDVVLPFNPLLHDSADHLYYQVGRAVEITLRAWASQNIEEMPRLRHWSFASFFSAGAMGFPLSACRYLLRPGSKEHEAILTRLPRELKLVWAEVLSAGIRERVRLLESTRNRLAPFFDSGILRRMFSSMESRFDVERFIRERRIVIVNVASYGRLDQHIGQTIGGLIVNEIIQRAMTLPPSVVDPSYLLLDEFQHFVGPDLYEALPTVRQIGLRLVLAHQSFHQLERGDIDLTGLIWQARSRLMFASDAEDADLLAQEFATLTFDPKRIKAELTSRKQRIAGHRREWTKSYTKTSTTSDSHDVSEGETSGRSGGQTRQPNAISPSETTGTSASDSSTRSERHATSHGESEGTSETLVPIHEDFEEISSRSFYSFEEQRIQWAKRIRTRKTGCAFGKFKDDDHLYDLLIDYRPVRWTPTLEAKVEELIQENFEQEFFVSKAFVEQQEELVRQKILTEPPVTFEEEPPSDDEDEKSPDEGDGSPPPDPFR